MTEHVEHVPDVPCVRTTKPMHMYHVQIPHAVAEPMHMHYLHGYLLKMEADSLHLQARAVRCQDRHLAKRESGRETVGGGGLAKKWGGGRQQREVPVGEVPVGEPPSREGVGTKPTAAQGTRIVTCECLHQLSATKMTAADQPASDRRSRISHAPGKHKRLCLALCAACARTCNTHSLTQSAHKQPNTRAAWKAKHKHHRYHPL